MLDPGVPGKGIVLTQLSNFWFRTLRGVVPNHLLATDLRGFPRARSPPRPRSPAGPAWSRRSGSFRSSAWSAGIIVGLRLEGVSGKRQRLRHALPAGLRQADRLPEPIFTPSTKAEVGHDENITFDDGRPPGRRRTSPSGSATLSLDLYTRAAALAEERGIIIADTKFEFGLDATAGSSGPTRR